MHFLMFAPNIAGNISGKLGYYVALLSVSSPALTKLNSVEIYTQSSCVIPHKIRLSENSACRNNHDNKHT